MLCLQQLKFLEQENLKNLRSFRHLCLSLLCPIFSLEKQTDEVVSVLAA